MDACLRAHGSTIEERLLRELGAYYGVTSFSTIDIQIEIPMEDICCAEGLAAIPEHWKRTVWFCRCFEEMPKLQINADIPSMFVSNAEEISRSEFHRIQTYCFANTHSWIDVALQVLHRVRWSPECSKPRQLYVPKMLPPSFTENHLHI